MKDRILRLATALAFLSNIAWAQAVRSPAARPAPRGVPRAAAPSTNAAILSYAGSVSILRFAETAPRPVTAAPMVLRTGDKVITGPDGSASLRLPDFSELRMGPG